MSHTNSTPSVLKMRTAQESKRGYFSIFYCFEPPMNVERNRIIAPNRTLEDALISNAFVDFIFITFCIHKPYNKYINVCVIFAFALNYIRANDFVV